MKLKFLYLVALLMLLHTGNSGLAQHKIYGHVFFEENGKKKALEGANVFFPASGKGNISSADGSFLLSRKESDPLQFVVSFVGYISDTLNLSGGKDEYFDVTLTKHISLSEAVVLGQQSGTIMSSLTPLKTETITSSGLQKMACCNLAESFENSASISVGFTDAVSGAKQVKLLGLSSLYSQTMIENVPALRGLASTFGWSYLPGSWLESIQISKGAASVLNGYESISGQMNMEIRKPNQTEDLFFNLYADHSGRYEGNASAAAKLADRLWTGLLLHASTESKEHDGNHDGFMDQPKSKLVHAYNRWFYLNEKGLQSRTGVRFLYEKREGGQLSEDNTKTGGSYRTNIGNKNFTVENKTGFPVGNKPGLTVGIINSFSHHEQESFFGKKSFGGHQNSFYSNWMFSSHSSRKHHYSLGLSFVYDDYRTIFEDLLPENLAPPLHLDRQELVPGAFAEYSFSPNKSLILIAGLRGDYNSRYGWMLTPRLNGKYNIREGIVLRASLGRGFRNPNVISENIGFLASSRKFYLEQLADLPLESAWNYGSSISFSIPIWDGRKMSLSMDYFHTRFENQAVVDIERNRNSLYVYPLQGLSFADAFQVDLSLMPFKGFDIFAAFRYNNTQLTYSDSGKSYQMEKALSSRFRGLVNLSYASNFKRWVFDVTAQVNGPSRLPGLEGYLSEYRESPPFPVFFAQVSKNSKRLDLYVGVENILDYVQANPILKHDSPFSRDFDSSLIWGPLMGRKFYAGLRLRIGSLR